MTGEPFAWVYILASQKRGTIYIGVTSNLAQRIADHRDGKAAGFTKRYKVHRLVHCEPFDDINEAIAREKALKKWRRNWKIRLVEESNPDWSDLWFSLNK
jgi:putative endonuclease